MTKEIQLTQGYVTLVDDEDYEWLTQWKWRALKSRNDWYAVRTITRWLGKREAIYMHRAIMDAPDKMDIDHRDGNGLNNQRDNLRVCTTAQNAMNQSKHADNTSGFKGVCWDKQNGKWKARIQVNGTNQHLGHFPTAEDAARAYDAASIEYHGEFAWLNFPY